ncbi:MAG: ABC transporter permease subunit [Bacillota bacterium]|nr:ABC transporter permease subunit [Bacillota bacterium]
MDKRLFVIIKKELLRVFTDRRLVFTVILLPGLSIALIYSIMGMVIGNIEDERSVHKYLMETYNAPSSFVEYVEKSPYDRVNLNEVSSIADLEGSKGKLLDEAIDLVLVFDNGFDQELGEYENLNIPNIDSYYNPISDYSQDARGYIVNSLLQDYKISIVGERLGNVEYTNVFTVDLGNDEASVAPEEKMVGTMLSRFFPILISIFLFAGAMGIGMDMVAGEKERGTMATILLTPVKRETIALGKLISLAVVAVVTTLSSLLGIILSIPFSSKIFGAAISINKITFTSWQIILILITLLLLVSIYVGLIILISVIAKSVKEAGSYIAPIYMIVIISGVLAMLGGGETTIVKYMIPIYGNIIVLQNIFSFDVNFMYFAVNSIVTILVTAGIVLVIRKMFYYEKYMF